MPRVLVDVEDLNLLVTDLMQKGTNYPQALLRLSAKVAKQQKTSTVYKLTMTAMGPKKIAVIKTARSHTDWGLKEAKAWSEADVPTHTGPKKYIELFASDLRAVGATVTISKGE